MNECDLCNEPCDEPFEGVITMYGHRECFLRSTLGGIGHLIAHEYWCSQRGDPDAGLTYRQSALLTDAWVHVMGVEAAAAIGTPSPGPSANSGTDDGATISE